MSRKIRPLRGQVVVREISPPSGPLWTPDPNPRQVHTHTGRVLALGPPARTPSGAEVPHEYQVGDLVQFHFTSLEKMARNPWEDGADALWIPQQNIDCVYDRELCSRCGAEGVLFDEHGAEVDLCEACDGIGRVQGVVP